MQISHTWKGDYMELWVSIPGTDGNIQVSNYGRMRSFLRGSEHILKTQKDSKGYHRLRYTYKRQKLSLKVHRAVAQAFIPNPNNYPQVNHIDGNKDNNAVSNLEWVTNQQNAIHAVRNGLWDSVFEKANKVNFAKRKKIVATKGGETLLFESVGEAEKHFDSRHITDAAKGKRSHVKGWHISYEGG